MFNAQCSNVHESAWLSRFLSPDPFVQTPTHSQSYNRYSYCLNNPLKYTDPSGYKQKPFFEWEMNYFNSGASLVFSRPDIGSLYLSGSMGYTYVGNNEYIDKASGETVGYETVFNNYILPAQNKESGNSESTDIVNLYFPRQTPVLTNKYIPGAIKWNVDGSTWYVFGFTTIYTSRTYEVGAPLGQGGGYSVWQNAAEKSGYASSTLGGLGNIVYSEYKGVERWVGKNGNYYNSSKVRMNGGYARSAQLAKSASMTYKIAGHSMTALSVGFTAVDFAYSDKSGGDYAKLVSAGIGVGLCFIPVIGPGLSIIYGIADSAGAFDGIYDYFDQ
jgi:hypothetical protein